MATRTRRLQRRIEAYSIGALLHLARSLPDRAAFALGDALGERAARLQPRRERVRETLRLAFGAGADEAEIERIARGFYLHAGRLCAEITRLGRWPPDRIRETVEVVGLEHAERALDAGRGLIAVAGHLGNWELGLAALGLAARERRGMQVRVVVEGQRHGPVREYLHAVRSRFAAPVSQEDPAECLAALRRGEVLFLMCDQWVRFGGLSVPFFGRPALSHAGAAMLHRLTRAPVLFGAARRLPDRLPRGGCRHRITVEPPLEMVRTRDREADLYENTTRIQAAIERAIRECPEQWTWTHRRWGQEQVEYAARRDRQGLP